MKAVLMEQERLWRKGFVKEMNFKSGVKGRGSENEGGNNEWQRAEASYIKSIVGNKINKKYTAEWLARNDEVRLHLKLFKVEKLLLSASKSFDILAAR